MEDEAEDMAFQEHGFFQEELKEKMEEEYSYALLESQFGQTKKNIRTGLEILTETREMERQADGEPLNVVLHPPQGTVPCFYSESALAHWLRTVAAQQHIKF